MATTLTSKKHRYWINNNLPLGFLLADAAVSADHACIAHINCEQGDSPSWPIATESSRCWDDKCHQPSGDSLGQGDLTGENVFGRVSSWVKH